jgi:diaminohydroxyphosphoribosylaminopyrimidine deaminase / 5-amino-6-(5-phosphoribosylamino)uracil reductase
MDDSIFMNQAATLAHKGRADVGTNPMVGAVFVKNKVIIAEGYHHIFGGAHAEIKAINAAKKKGVSLKGSILYVTLEPCAHTGKQGPCTEALKKTEIKKVIYAQIDPNPLVSGRGIKLLEAASIETQEFNTPETIQLNEIYLKNTTTRKPWIHLKSAATRNGKISLEKGKSTQISNQESSNYVHELRQQHDAILIGLNTLLIDNPRLTARTPKKKICKDSPIRIILDSQLKSPPHSKIFTQPGQTILATTQTSSSQKWGENTFILTCKKSVKGHIDLEDLLKKLFKLGIRSILVEGGERITTSFLNAGLADKISLCLTQAWAADQAAPSIWDFKQIEKLNLVDASIKIINNDIWISGTPKKK